MYFEGAPLCAGEGQQADLRVTNLTEYIPRYVDGVPKPNQMYGVGLATVNVVVDSDVTLLFEFVDSATGEPIVVPYIYFTAYDIDDGATQWHSAPAPCSTSSHWARAARLLYACTVAHAHTHTDCSYSTHAWARSSVWTNPCCTLLTPYRTRTAASGYNNEERSVIEQIAFPAGTEYLQLGGARSCVFKEEFAVLNSEHAA